MGVIHSIHSILIVVDAHNKVVAKKIEREKRIEERRIEEKKQDSLHKKEYLKKRINRLEREKAYQLWLEIKRKNDEEISNIMMCPCPCNHSFKLTTKFDDLYEDDEFDIGDEHVLLLLKLDDNSLLSNYQQYKL